MAVIDKLQVIDGYFENDRFIMRGIAGNAIYGAYKTDGLRSMARLIGDTPITLTIDKDRYIRVPIEANARIKYELNLIADESENGIQ